MTSVAAMAACGGAPTLVALSGLVGPPSITATEASTDQALELIRKRREEATGSCPAGFARSGGNCVPVGSAQQASLVVPAAQPAPAPTVTTTTTTGPAPASAPAQKRAPRPAQSASASAPAASAPAPAYGYSGGSIKDGGYDMPTTIRATGLWAEGYYDHEKHSNLNPGQQANPTRRQDSGGIVSGADVSQFSTGGVLQGYQFGFFSGYNNTRSKFSDTTGDKLQSDGTTQSTLTTGSRQDISGGFLGLYGAYVRGAFSTDLTFKVDFFDIEQQQTEQVLGCGARPSVTTIANAAMTNYIVASNANYRIPLSGNFYFEPTVGVRYTVTDFGGNAPALGLRDGEAFRVQGGARIGTQFVTRDGWLWNTSLTGLLYSDVSLSGFVVPSATPLIPTTPLVDEGKLMAMGILESRVDVGYGYTLYGDVNVRGGDNVFGYGARAGIRYQW